jgi:hypothetical protein
MRSPVINQTDMNALLQEITQREGTLINILHESKKKVIITYRITDIDIQVTGPSVRNIQKAMYHQRMYNIYKNNILISKLNKTEATC